MIVLRAAVAFVLLCGLGAPALRARVAVSLLERWAFAGVAGGVVFSLACFVVGSIAGLPVTVFLCGAAGAAGLWTGRRRLFSRRAFRLDGPGALALLCAAPGVLLLMGWVRVVTEGPEAGGWVLTSYYDHYIHMSTVQEILRGVPPAQMPFFAGEPFWPYHLFPNLFEAGLMVAVGGRGPDVLLVHHALVHGIGWLACGVLTLAIARRVGRGWLAGGAALALLFAPRAAGLDILAALQRNTPSLVGVAVCLAIVLVIVSERRMHPPRGAATAANWRSALLGTLGAGLFSTKSNLFLVLAPGVAASLVSLRPWRRLLPAVIGGLLVAGPMVVHFLSRPKARSIGIDYGAFAGWLAQSEIPAARAMLGIAGAGPILVVLAWALWCLGPAMVGLLAVRRLGGSARGFFAVAGLAFLVVALLPVETGSRQYEAWNVAHFIRFPLVFVGAALGGAEIQRLARRVTQRSALAAVVIFGVLAAGSSVLVGRPRNEGELLAPRDLLLCCEAIRASTPPDAVVASTQTVFGGTWLSTLCDRRVVVERAVLAAAFFPSAPARLADLERLYHTDDPAVVREIAGRWGITVVLDDPEHRLRATEGFALIRQTPTLRAFLLPPQPPPRTPVPESIRRRYEAVLRVLMGEPASEVARAAGVSVSELERWVEAGRRLSPPEGSEP